LLWNFNKSSQNKSLDEPGFVRLFSKLYDYTLLPAHCAPAFAKVEMRVRVSMTNEFKDMYLHRYVSIGTKDSSTKDHKTRTGIEPASSNNRPTILPLNYLIFSPVKQNTAYPHISLRINYIWTLVIKDKMF
jgi:hypothetical protein